MKLLLVSEGKRESGGDECVGALETIARRLINTEFECDVDRVSNNSVRTHRGKGKGYYKRAIRWMLEAANRGYDAIVFLIDEDGEKERVAEIKEAQEYMQSSFPRALGVAIRTFDAWMLADEKALSSVLDCEVDRQPMPESIADPKTTCKELLEASRVVLSQTAMYAQIAGVCDFAVLRQRCDKSFAPFAQRIEQLYGDS